MAKIKSYIKSLIPSQKAIRRLPHWQNLLPLSPRDQHEISGVVIPRVGANIWNNNNTDLEYLQKLYDCHDLVHSSIDLVSSTFSLAKLKVKKYDIKTQKYNYVPDHPIQKLLENPNNSMTGYDLRQAYIVHRLLFGTMACILLRSGMTTSLLERNKCPECKKLEHDGDCLHILWHFNTGPITQIMPVHLDRLEQRVVNTDNGKRTYFIYNYNHDGVDIETLVHPNNILTDPNYNPGGSYYGTSPTAMVKRWLEIDLGMSTQIGAYLANNAIPSMILNLKPPKFTEGGGRIDDPSALLDMMEERWMKDFSLGSYMSGYNNRPKKPAFTYGDLEILKIQDGIKDIVQKPLFYEIENRIAMAYKVPRSFYEFGSDYGVDPDKENKDFFNYAIAPQLLSFKSKMERYILPSYNDPTIELEWDLSSVGIASFLEDKRKVHILKVWELGLDTRDSIREQLGMNPIGGELGDDLYRETVMSDGNNNGAIGASLQRRNKRRNKLEDNRLKPSREFSQTSNNDEEF